MAALVDPRAVEVVTWAPTTAARRHARGFDQSQLLARAVAHQLRLPCRRLLTRRAGPAQTGRDEAGRRAGPSFGSKCGRCPARVLLIDDIVTTGATVSAAARALRSAGADQVHVLAAARTSRRAYNPSTDGSHDPVQAR